MSVFGYNRRAYKEAYETEHHVHNRERWFGKSADQSGTDWAADNLTAFRAISGNGVYGADANDEALLLGTSDTPNQTGMVKFDFHRLLITGVSEDTPYKLRISWGSGTMAAAVAAGQYTETMVQFDSANPQLSAGIPLDLIMPRLDSGTKAWAQVKNATDNATIDFFIGLHEYEM